MTKPFNGLTPAQAERLAILAEEAGEIVQAVGKILRHGYESYNPDGDIRVSNRESLERELGDLSAAAQLMAGAGDIRAPVVDMWRGRKLARLTAPAQQYLHHQRDEA